MKRRSLLLVFMIAFVISYAQDKNAEAIAHYTKAEEFFNQGTLVGAEKCIEELAKAEEVLGSTNSKILYLKIMAANRFCKREYYYAYDMVKWVKEFFKITDANTFPADKYSDILNSEYLGFMVKDTAFERKIWKDSSYIKNYFKYGPRYKFTGEAEYEHAKQFWHEGRQTTKDNDPDLWRNEDFGKAHIYFYLAANDGNKEAMSALSRMYLDGQGVLKNEKESLEYALMAKDTSMVALLYNISGEKIITDGNKVVEWCTGVANSADSNTAQNAAIALGKIYENGLGNVPKDNMKAVQWYITATDKGCECEPYIGFIINLHMHSDDKQTQKAIREMVRSWEKARRKK